MVLRKAVASAKVSRKAGRGRHRLGAFFWSDEHPQGARFGAGTTCHDLGPRTSALLRAGGGNPSVEAKRPSMHSTSALNGGVFSLTPELALVDHELRDKARTLLPASSDTLAHLELLTRAHRIASRREGRSRIWRRRTREDEPVPGLRERLERFVAC